MYFLTIKDMENLNKTIKQLSKERYEYILNEISGGRKTNPYLVLENAREKNLSDDEMRDLLGVNASAYYTLKSRLNQKVASLLAQDIDNPISGLLDQVKRVPALLYGTNKQVTITVLKDLEKQLKEYDLNNELIVVYKALVRLHRYSEDLNQYEKLYKMHVAFSLAVSKAEDLFYDFLKKLGYFLLSYNPVDLESVRNTRRELSNMKDLYDSHRLFVFYNIVRTYYICTVPHKKDSLKESADEILQVLDKIENITERYNLDIFYQNIKIVIDMLRFEFYINTESHQKADFYYRKVNPHIPELAQKHVMAFYVVQFLNSKIRKFLFDEHIETLTDIAPSLITHFDINQDETYHYLAYKRYLAVCKFYENDYAGAARHLNDIRNQLSLKQYHYEDVECKLFQALQYCLSGKSDLATNILNNIKRQIKDEGEMFSEKVNLFIKLLKTAIKFGDVRQKLKKLNQLWAQFQQLNEANAPSLLWYVKLNDGLFRLMGNQ